jgi:hypothetical protein
VAHPAQEPEDPPKSGDSRPWSFYEDMMEGEEPSAVPLYGFRILIFVNDAGEEWVRWATDGEPTVAETVAVMERTKFMVMMKEHTDD